MSNRLNISVMSLRDYPADEEAPSKFYVRVRVNDGEAVKTEVKEPKSAGSNVQFMEHLIVPYKGKSNEELVFELFQSSQTGDLVLGECKMRVSDVVAAGAVHSWFPFVDASDSDLKAGELLMAIQAKNSKNSPTKSQSVTTSAPVPVKRAPRQRSATRHSIRLPMPLAVGLALLAGAYAFKKNRRPVYYDVEEGDTLCTISSCYNKDYRDVYALNKSVVSNPDLIYPGDRLRIR